MDISTDTLAELLKAQRRTNKLLARLVEFEEERRQDEREMFALNDALLHPPESTFDPDTQDWMMNRSTGQFSVKDDNGDWRPATADESAAISAGVRRKK